VTAEQSLPCTKSSEKKLDALFAKLFVVGDSGPKFSENSKQLSIFCKQIKNIFKKNPRICY
jgi:hypothetical protein